MGDTNCCSERTTQPAATCNMYCHRFSASFDSIHTHKPVALPPTSLLSSFGIQFMHSNPRKVVKHIHTCL